MSRCCSKENSECLSLEGKEGSWHCWAWDHLFAKLLKPRIIAVFVSSCSLGLDYSWDTLLFGLYTFVLSSTEETGAVQ